MILFQQHTRFSRNNSKFKKFIKIEKKETTGVNFHSKTLNGYLMTKPVDLYRTYLPKYTPTEDADPQIRQLEKKVQDLVTKLQKEERRFCCGSNKDIVNDLKIELEETRLERDLLFQRAKELKQNLNKATEEVIKSRKDLDQSNKRVASLLDEEAVNRRAYFTAGMGFGGGAAGATLFALNPIGTATVIAVSTIAGMLLGRSK